MNRGATALADPPARTKDERAADRSEKFLTFYLDTEEYGLEILKVHEIIKMMAITPVPRTPDYVRGVINLRGKVIPTVDLRCKFGMPALAQTDETCIIVVQANGVQVGIVVDRVSEVMDIVGGDIEEAPSFGEGVETDYILGIGKTEGRVRLLLDIDKVLNHTDLHLMQQMAGEDGMSSPATTAQQS